MGWKRRFCGQSSGKLSALDLNELVKNSGKDAAQIRFFFPLRGDLIGLRIVDCECKSVEPDIKATPAGRHVLYRLSRHSKQCGTFNA